MGYAPMVFRLGPAFTEHNIQGIGEVEVVSVNKWFGFITEVFHV